MRISSLTLVFIFLATVNSHGCREVYSSTSQEEEKTGVYEISDPSRISGLKLKAGDAVVLKNGTYSSASISISANGTADKPVVLRAETPGKVVLTGKSSVKLSGSHIVCEGLDFRSPDTGTAYPILTAAKGSSYCTFRSCSIDGSDSKPSEVDSKWVSLYGRHHEVSGCSFIDKKNMGCLLVVWMEDGIVPEHSILNNYFSRPNTVYSEDGDALNGQESIRIGNSDYSMSEAGCTVKGNHFYRCHGERAEIISSKSCGNLYEGNLFEDSDGSLTLRHGNRCIVRGNYFVRSDETKMGGVRIIGENHLVENNFFLNLNGSGYKSALSVVRGESNAALNGYWTVRNAIVRNNVFIGCSNGITVNCSSRSTQDTAPVGTLIENNLIISEKSSAKAVEVIEMPASAIRFSGNRIYGGRQTGVSLETLKDKPAAPDCTREIEAIRSSAGINWK